MWKLNNTLHSNPWAKEEIKAYLEINEKWKHTILNITGSMREVHCGGSKFGSKELVFTPQGTRKKEN